MATRTIAHRPLLGARRAVLDLGRYRTAASLAYLGCLVALSLVLRVRLLGAGLWIDDAQTVGIATHGVGALPRLLHQDGAPPLFYALLSLWIDAFGSGQVAVCALALTCATLAVGAGLWAAGSLFGLRAGIMCATAVALNPLLGVLADQARMYSLVVLLSLLATASFVHLFVYRRRRHLVPFTVLLTLLLYSHYWALFLCGGLALAAGWLVERSTHRRAIARDALLSFGGAGLLFAPWLGILVFQTRHTGAPWSVIPETSALGFMTGAVLGATLLTPGILAAGAGLAAAVRRATPEYHVVLALLIASVSCAIAAWSVSQVSPNWAPRYFAVLFGPLMLLLALGLARVGPLGPVALLLLALGWMAGLPRTDDYKSNARRVLAAVDDTLRPGDAVLSPQPEQVPVLAYYLRPGLKYMTPAGAPVDPAIFDWRDGVRRMRTSRVQSDLQPLLDRLPVGRRALLVKPEISPTGDQREPVWPGLVRRRTLEWSRALAHDRRFRLVGSSGATNGPVLFSSVTAAVYVKARQ